MREFEHINATSLNEVFAYIKDDANTAIIAGGTDLLTRIKSRLSTPSRLINIKTVPEMDQISYNENSGLSIGALTLLNKIERDQIINDKFSILAQTVSQIATPQIRNMGTIGGNLCQKPRCLYYRNPSFHCLRKGGKSCFVVRGESRYSAIIDGGPCFMVHPSDLAPTLIALDASVKICSSDNERVIPIESFFVSPKFNLQKENILNKDELISGIQIPTPSDHSYGVFIKAMERKAWDFALASVALQVSIENNIIKDARLVLGGISPSPYRAKNAELIMKNNCIDDKLTDQVCEVIGSSSKPLKDNGYKVLLVKSSIKRAMKEINCKLNETEG